MKLIEGLLVPFGYELHKANNGSDALYIMNKTDIDLVLLDIMMPVMDGLEVVPSRPIRKLA